MGTCAWMPTRIGRRLWRAQRLEWLKWKSDAGHEPDAKNRLVRGRGRASRRLASIRDVRRTRERLALTGGRFHDWPDRTRWGGQIDTARSHRRQQAPPGRKSARAGG